MTRILIALLAAVSALAQRGAPIEQLTFTPCHAGLSTVVNQIPGPKEPLPLIESEHDNLTPQKGRACPARTKEVLDLLVKGGAWESNGLNQ